MRKSLLFHTAWLLLVLLAAAGCQPPALPGNSAANNQEPSQPEAANLVTITDPAELERLWSDYLFDGITTVQNCEFTDPAAIGDRFFLINFALMRLVKDGEATVLSSDATHSMIRIPTPAQVQAKLRAYFNIDLEFDLMAELEKGIGIEPGATTVPVYCEQIHYTAGNPWSLVLAEVTYDPEQHTYSVRIDSIANQDTGRVGRSTHITLKEREDQSLCYKSVRYEYPPTHLVAITGDYTPLNPAVFGAEDLVYTQPIPVYGTELGSDLFLRGERRSDLTRPDSETTVTFSVYDPAAGQVLHQLELPQSDGNRLHGVRILPDQLIFKFTDRFYVTGLDLKPVGSPVPLPEAVKAVLADDSFFAGYDVSADRQRITFTDRDGLHLYDLKTGEIRKLASPLPVNDGIMELSYILVPQYSAQDTAIIAPLSGYEGYWGAMTVNVSAPDRQYIDRSINLLQGLDYTNIRYPIPDLRFGATEPSESASRSPFGIRMMDLAAGSDLLQPAANAIAPVAFSDPANQHPLFEPGNNPLYNGRYLAYIAAGPYKAGQQPEEQIYRVVRVNLATMHAETVLSIQAGVPYLRALTGDGRIMLSYHFERESGLLLTGK